MILRLFPHALTTLGATVALTPMLAMTADEFVTIWLAFLAVAWLVEWLRDDWLSKPAPPSQPPSVLDLFERIEL